jgi:flavodoxin
VLRLLASIACLPVAEAAGQGRRDGENPAYTVLIVYLSRTNNTKAVATFIYERMGGTLVPLELSTPYPRDYDATVRQVAHENETGHLPPLTTRIDRVDQYGIVFLGFPTWGMQLPPPVESFLHAHDLGGKIVIPFNTNAGYGVGSSFRTVKELCPYSTVLEGYTTRGGVERDGELLAIRGARAETVRKDVDDWLTNVGVRLPLSPR